jgi:P-type conjugative transfer protein TrbG
MTMRWITVGVAATALAGCNGIMQIDPKTGLEEVASPVPAASMPHPSDRPVPGATQMVPAHATIEPQMVVNVPPPPTAPAQLKAITSGSTSASAASRSMTGIAAAQAARAAATETAGAADYIDAVAVYDFVPGRVYHVYTSPDFLTAISLRAGEKLLSKAAADTSRWQIGDTLAGADANQTALVVIKPSKEDLHTNLILTTNERSYFLDLESRPGNQYQSAVRWNYPQELVATTINKTAQMNRERQETAISGVNLENLNYDYRVETEEGNEPSWLPREVFDDGKKTYINFPAELGTMEAPPLYIRTTDGQADLVNYRVKGHFYVVDRLFDHAELRLGHDPQTVVAIENKHRVKSSFWSW